MEVDNSFDMTSSDRLVAETILIKSAGDNNAFLIVEGDIDKKFYTRFVCDQERVLKADVSAIFFDININGGKKDKVIEAIKIVNEEGRKGIVGIIDSDFDNLNNVPLIENLYRTDTHDLESMLLKSENL